MSKTLFMVHVEGDGDVRFEGITEYNTSELILNWSDRYGTLTEETKDMGIDDVFYHDGFVNDGVLVYLEEDTEFTLYEQIDKEVNLFVFHCYLCSGKNMGEVSKLPAGSYLMIDCGETMRKLYIEIAKEKPNRFGWEKYVPIMSDFYEILMNQPEDEAKDIALSLELFVNGSLNIFNHQTNVDVDNRFTVYGIRDLGTELSPITMLVMMESIQNRIIANGKKGIATWLYIDEFHVLLNSEYSAKYLQQLWKKVRKQDGLCTRIT